jgi:hypothetical protein
MPSASHFALVRSVYPQVGHINFNMRVVCTLRLDILSVVCGYAPKESMMGEYAALNAGPATVAFQLDAAGISSMVLQSR